MSSGAHRSWRETLWGFLLVVLLVPPLVSLVLNVVTNLALDGGVIAILLIVSAIVLCLQFGSSGVRLAVGFVAFCLISRMLGQQQDFHLSFWPFLLLIVVTIVAYFIREYRFGNRHDQPKVHGAERTPVLPPISEEHE